MAEPYSPDLARLGAQATALLASDRLTVPTRDALAARLAWRRGKRHALPAGCLHVLEAVARRLVPLGALDDVVDLAGRLDADLARGSGDGWRYAAMPADAAAMRAGLERLERDGFLSMDEAAQKSCLEAVRAGMDDWPVPSALWFEELSARLVELAYGHPLVQLSIGYDGMADADGIPVNG